MQRSDTELVRTVERVIRDNRLLERGDSIVAAVSGGPDSTALLHILHRLSEAWDWKLTAAHLNHQFRGAESDGEAELVAAFAAGLGIPCQVGSADVPAWIRETGLNAQTAARERRYAFLQEAAANVKANRLAVAHHADDQAETVLMRILRGTGPSGLSGIPMRRQLQELELVRPLLRIYKDELVRYCQLLELPYAEDSSNGSRKYTRNRIRLDVWPVLEPFNPQLPESLNRLAAMMQEEDDYLQQEAKRIWPQLFTEENEGIAFSRTAFLAVHIALQRRLIHLILNYVCAGADASDYNRVERIRIAIQQDRPPALSIHLHGTAVLQREYDRVSVIREGNAKNSKPEWEADLSGSIEQGEAWDGVVAWGGALYGSIHTAEEAGYPGGSIQGSQRADLVEGLKISSHQEAFFDFDQVAFPLTVRRRQEGDRLEPLGLNGTKKVKDMFIDRKVPQPLRDQLPVIVDAAGRLLWIPGVGRSRYALVGPSTKQVLRLRYTSGSSGLTAGQDRVE